MIFKGLPMVSYIREFESLVLRHIKYRQGTGKPATLINRLAGFFISIKLQMHIVSSGI